MGSSVAVEEQSLISAGTQLGDIVVVLRQLPRTVQETAGAARATGSPAAAAALWELLGCTIGALAGLATGFEEDQGMLGQVLQAYRAGEAFIERINERTGTTQTTPGTVTPTSVPTTPTTVTAVRDDTLTRPRIAPTSTVQP